VKRDFRGNTTVFTVAHRLNTVVFYDRILMLSQGSVLEYAPPLELLTTAEGAFRKLAEESGDLEGLMQAARESAAERENFVTYQATYTSAADTGVVVEQNSSWISVD
jgi:ABC-type multidrug transport system ATPase subunit